MSLTYPTKENSSCMLLGTIGNPNSNCLNKDIIIMNKKKTHKKQTESLEMMPLQNWLIQQVKCSWLHPWGFRFFLSLLCRLTFVLPLSSPESQNGYGCSWWRFQESQCLWEERLSVISSGPKQTALLSSPCKKNGITMTGADKSDLPLG